MIHKRKFRKLSFIQIKTCSVEDTVKRLRQATDLEDIFVEHILDTRMYKEHL